MIIGIIGAWIFIKKRVYVCPPTARCPGSFNPDISVLQDIRTSMQYWLHGGMIIFGVGLVKLVAYQAWSAMRQRGNTIDILGLNIGVVNGSAYAAANLLLHRRRNRSLGVFALAHIAIITAISFVFGKSVIAITNAGSVDLLFDYPQNISFLNEDGYFGVIEFGPTWIWLYKSAADLNALYNETYSGTLVIQDSRAEYGINARPSGQRISGSVSCVDPSANITVNTTGFFETGILPVNITLYDTGFNFSESKLVELDSRNFAIGKLTSQYLSDFDPSLNTFVWFTITEGIIPNAIEVDLFNGLGKLRLFIGLCEHTVTFSNLPQNDASGNEMQDINPSQPIVYLFPGQEIVSIPSSQPNTSILLTPANRLAICDDACLATAVWSTILTWWGTDVYCYGGVLTPVGENKAGEDVNQSCPSLDGEMWNRTLALVLDGMLHTFPKFGNTSQTLSAHAKSIGTWRWWLQGIIPLSAFILYVACLAYTVTVYWAGETMKELNLLEVVNATRAEEERLTKSVMVGGKLKEQVGIRLSEWPHDF